MYHRDPSSELTTVSERALHAVLYRPTTLRSRAPGQCSGFPLPVRVHFQRLFPRPGFVERAESSKAGNAGYGAENHEDGPDSAADHGDDRSQPVGDQADSSPPSSLEAPMNT